MLKKGHYLPYIIIFITLFTFSGCQKIQSENEPPTVSFGMLDLSGWDFEENGPVWLDGKWEFYWNAFLNPDNFQSTNRPHATGYFPVPGDWTKTTANNQNFPGNGFATYRLIINVDKSKGEYAITYQNYGEIFHRIWVNGELISSHEIAKTNDYYSLPQFYHLVDVFEIDSPYIELIVQLSNYSYMRNFSLGTERKVIGNRYRFFFKTWFYFFLLGGLLIMTIYHYGMYYSRKKDKAPLYFAIFCLTVAFNTVGPYIAVYFPLITRNISIFNFIIKASISVNFLGFWALFNFYLTIWPESFSKKLIKTIDIILLGSFTLFTCLPSVGMTGGFIAVIYVFFTPLIGVLISIILFKTFSHKRKGAIGHILAVTPLFLYWASSIIDTIFLAGDTGLGIPYYLIPMLIYSYIIFQSFLLSRSFSRVLTEKEDLTNNLEKKVVARTAELEIERNKLEHQNMIMTEELELARRIQSRFIPDASPSSNIAFYYKPLATVGGDFIDFIPIHSESSNKKGIFISDVSGHGVPAAFITSMIKSFSLENADKTSNPSLYLTMLNDFLLPMTAGNFVTVFYAIFDSTKNEILYANAGHNSPYIIGEDYIASIFPKGGAPLAVLSSHDLYLRGIGYQNYRLKLKGKNKVFLYTDGLTETISVYGTKHNTNNLYADFEKAGLYPTLNEIRHLNCRQAVKLMTERLIQFRGKDEFEDDVCMVCIDIE